jgi:hypothetical protein
MHDLLAKFIKATFPLKELITTYKNRLPWLTPGLKLSIQNKHYLYSRYLKHPAPASFTKYKTFKNLLTKTIRLAERNHYQDALLANRNNLKKSWLIIKEIITKKGS